MKKLLFFLSLLSFPAFAFTQARGTALSFNKVLPPNGENFVHVTGIVQDSTGYMWFATKRGLFRYDGYEMLHYKNDPLDKNSIPSNELETICIDHGGNIWLGSLGAGLFRFDPIHEKRLA